MRVQEMSGQEWVRLVPKTRGIQKTLEGEKEVEVDETQVLV
jgi:hypothetical protein